MKPRITMITLGTDDLEAAGYAGYFQDPDGHLWEVAWNPQIPPQDEGRLI
jgi:predicted lactoylglutathione lyase